MEGNGKIAMVVYSQYPEDPRVRREAEALWETGLRIDVFCQRTEGRPFREDCNGIRVYRLPIRANRSGKLNYLVEYAMFLFMTTIFLALFHLIRRYQIVHVHNMPDVLVFCALFPRLTGAKVMLDLHDPMPEVCMTKYSLGEEHPLVRLLCLCEKVSIKFAHHVLTPNIAFRERFIARGCPAAKIDIVMNSAQETVFNEKNGDQAGSGDNFVIMFHGVINERSGLDKAMDAVARIRDKIPRCSFCVYGNGEFAENVMAHVKELGLNEIVTFYGYKPQEEIVKRLRTTSIGIIPNIMSPFTNINLPTRILEYMCLGIPAVAPRTKGVLDYFNEESLYLFEAGNVDSLAATILDAYENPAKRGLIARNGADNYQPYKWERQKKTLVKIVDDLLPDRNKVDHGY